MQKRRRLGSRGGGRRLRLLGLLGLLRLLGLLGLLGVSQRIATLEPAAEGHRHAATGQQSLLGGGVCDEAMDAWRKSVCVLAQQQQPVLKAAEHRARSSIFFPHICVY